MNNKNMSDKEIMEDVLTSQKHITGTYNTFTNECVNQQLRTDFLNILRDEHNLQQTVFDQMQSRGWYSPAAAEQQKVADACKKYINIGETL